MSIERISSDGMFTNEIKNALEKQLKREMSLSLVAYSSSSDDKEIPSKIDESVKKPAKAKLPNPFQKQGEIEEGNSPADHNGRVRSFAHERGIWATHVYIQCPQRESIQFLQTELIKTMKANSDFEVVDVHPMDDLHMSFTRTCVLRHHWINEFTKSLQQCLQNSQRFQIPLNSIRIYCNDNRTRTFISLAITDVESNAHSTLCDIVRRLDGCLSEFNLAPFYEEASFHVSLLWCLGDRMDDLQSLLPVFSVILERLLSLEPNDFTLNAQELHAKIGNKLFTFQL